MFKRYLIGDRGVDLRWTRGGKGGIDLLHEADRPLTLISTSPVSVNVTASLGHGDVGMQMRWEACCAGVGERWLVTKCAQGH